MTQWLDDPRLLEDVQKRLAKKLQHLDAPPRRTLRWRAQGLATAQAERQPNQAERYRDSLDAVLERAGFDLSGRTCYRLQDADARLGRLFGADVQLRMAAKTRLAQLGLLRGGEAVASTPVGEHVLHRLITKVLGPTDEAKEKKKDEDAHQQASGSRTLRASADRPRRGTIHVNARGILVDARGKPITLRCEA